MKTTLDNCLAIIRAVTCSVLAASATIMIPTLVEKVYNERGYFAIGGEWIIMGAAIALTILATFEWTEIIHSIKDDEEQEGE